MSAVRLGLLTPLSGAATLVTVLHGLVGLAVLCAAVSALVLARAVWVGRVPRGFTVGRRQNLTVTGAPR